MKTTGELLALGMLSDSVFTDSYGDESTFFLSNKIPCCHSMEESGLELIIFET